MILPISFAKRRAMERTLLEWLRRKLPEAENLPLGLSDDAALLHLKQSGSCVITTDMLCDGIHFDAGQLAPDLIGRKAIAVNLSDLAAMAAEPIAFFVSIAVPRDWQQTQVEMLYGGMIALADEFDCHLAGGDTNRWDGRLVINVVACGLPTASGVWRRTAGQVGDWLLVTGALGGSILEHHYRFTPRVAEALQLAAEYKIHAALDISDGLALDASRLGEASRCGVLLDLDAVPISSAAIALANQTDYARTPLQHALGDGEDFELLISLTKEEAQRLIRQKPLRIPVAHIGELIEPHGLWQRSESGELIKLHASGYLH